MSIIAKSSGETLKKELIPAGSHIARCYQMIDLGTHEESFEGNAPKPKRKVSLTFEFPTEMRQFGEDNPMQPMAKSKIYTLSMHPKSNMRTDLESWRGKGFSDEEAKAFDITKLLGIPCMISIVHAKGKDGNMYANIGSISGVPKGMNIPKQINASFEFNFNDRFDIEWVEECPGWLKEIIKSSDEYKERTGQLMAKEEEKKQAPDYNEQNNDLPF